MPVDLVLKDGIFIENDNVYFKLINITAYSFGSRAGIKLKNVSNGLIYDCDTSISYGKGILLDGDCNNNTIRENIIEYNEHALKPGSDAAAICFVSLNIAGKNYSGVAKHKDEIKASLSALLNAINIWNS